MFYSFVNIRCNKKTHNYSELFSTLESFLKEIITLAKFR